MNGKPSLSARLRMRAQAWRDLYEIAEKIGPFPLDAVMIDARLEDEAADALEEALKKAQSL